MSESFHVFLSHNSQDKTIVRKLAQELKSYDLRVWLDEEQLVPGRPWQEALETVIQTTQAAAVLIGESGLGPWEEPEMRACLSEFVNRKLPVIPVLLPGTHAAPKLPLFLRSFTWVDLRDGLTDLGLEKLVWGITGAKPAKPPRREGGGLHPESIQCELHAFMPIPSRANPSKIDIDETLKKILRLNPGVAIIDLKLEGDAEDDYTGADLALRIKKSCNDCCIILVSSYFDADPKFLDNIEIFRYRVDRNQSDYGKNLQANFIDAVRHNVAAINLRHFSMEQPAFKQHLNQSPSRVVYISYARGSSEDIVNRIAESLKSHDYDVRRDTNNIPYTAPISSFMKEIGRGHCVIVVISDKYLRSPYCMYELLEVYRNKGFHQRVCPVVLADARVSRFSEQFTYLDYWSNQVQQMEELIRKINLANLAAETLQEFYKYQDISQNAAKLLAFLADMQHLTLDDLEKNEFAILRARVDQCLNGARFQAPSRERKPSEGSIVPTLPRGNEDSGDPAPSDRETAQAGSHAGAWEPEKPEFIAGLRDFLADGTEGPAMVWLPGGEFIMGQDDSPYNHEKPAHPVRVDAISIGQYPVTFAEYDRFCLATQRKQPDDRSWGRDSRPVINVNWEDAQAYCEWLGQQTGEHYRLATEAEWEYACRAGSTTRYCYGDDESHLGDYAWYSNNANGQTHPVGEKKPNAWQLHDMHGNVWEWCEDWHSKDYYQQFMGKPQHPASASEQSSSGSASKNPNGPASGSDRVVRGGSWNSVAGRCRSAYRIDNDPSNRFIYLGFRLSRTGPWRFHPVTLGTPVGRQPLADEDDVGMRMPTYPPKPRFQPYEVFHDRLTDFGENESPAMVYLPGGDFLMGDETGNDSEKPVHAVRLNAFAMGRTPVTWGEYWRFCESTQQHWPEWLEQGNEYHLETGKNDYYPNRGVSRDGLDLPVVGISWEDARAYCQWLSVQTGETYALPTEAQWEYACRAGNPGRWCFGDDETQLAEYAWFSGNAGGKLHPVMNKAANHFGLYDVHGNVWEWCADWYSQDYYTQLADEVAEGSPETPASGLIPAYNNQRSLRVRTRVAPRAAPPVSFAAAPGTTSPTTAARRTASTTTHRTASTASVSAFRGQYEWLFYARVFSRAGLSGIASRPAGSGLEDLR
jgi:formylglycine-generating enzyme required for sulfatase activity